MQRTSTKRVTRTNRERSEATSTALMRAARELFVRHGYAETATPSIVARARITRGALYHHFADKRALFRAVVEEEARAVARAVEQATSALTDPIAALLTGSDAYLKAMTVPGRTRLLLVEGPATLGVAAMLKIDESTSGRTLQDGLKAAMAVPGGVILERLAPLVAAAFDRAALEVDSGADVEEVASAMRFILLRMVDASV
jgi:AcrR family transcriptional regulator